MIFRITSVTRWHRLRWALVSALLAGLSTVAWADPVAPGRMDHQIVVSVAKLVKLEHLSRHPLDKEISERCLKEFLKQLDPTKAYFYQSDIDEFTKRKDELSDAIGRGDISFAYTVFRTFLQRVDERMKMIDEALAMPHDFTVDEEMVVDRDAAKYARNAAEALDRWRKRIKYDLLVMKANKNEDDERKAEGKEDVKPSLPESEKPLRVREPGAKRSAVPAREKGEGQDARDKLTRRYHSIAKRWHQIDSDELLEMYLNSFTRSFDPHTDYMSVDTQKNFDIAMSLELEGIGAELRPEDGYTVVKKVIPGGAAFKDGRLKAEDKIVGVGQNGEGEMVDVIDMKLNDVVKLIRGKRATTVRLEVMPAGSTERKIYKIAREKIELKDQEARGAVFVSGKNPDGTPRTSEESPGGKVFDAGRRPDGTPYRVGVIDLPSFYRDMAGDRRGLADFKSTTRDVHAILDDFKRQGVDAVVLDLRFNGGGALNEAISLTGLFIHEGPVVQVKDADGNVQPYNDRDPAKSWTGPLVVLTNKFSASASEILAGAIQDYGRGLIIGDHSTHGKGTVQSLLDLAPRLFNIATNVTPMGALKITMQQFYRPNGDSTQKHGVVSDIELPSLAAQYDEGEAALDYPLEFDKVERLRHKDFGYVNPAMVDQLRRLSEQRVQSSEKFQKVTRTIARFKEQKAKKYVTLNEAKFLKERADFNADKEEEKAIEKRSEQDNGVIERDYYLDEVLAITTDYLNLERIAASAGVRGCPLDANGTGLS